jgi:DNA sulfur modification protein DndD
VELFMYRIFIDWIKITNFGPFYGEHFFDFQLTDRNKTTILIGGKNGVGKTHLLRALYLCVVGESGAVDLKKVEAGSEATRFELSESLNRIARQEGINECELEIKLTKQQHDNELLKRSIIIRRKIRYRPSSPPIFNSEIYLLDENRTVVDEKEVQRLRDTFLPRHLARFFFFDAEKSQSIKLSEREIIEGIARILGLHSYSELENDLRQLVQLTIPKRFGKGTEKERQLNKIVAEIQKLKADLNILNNEEDDKQNDLREIDYELREIEDELKSIGAVDPQEYKLIQDKRAEIKIQKEKLEELLREAWEKQIPVGLMGKTRVELYEALKKEELRRDWENRRASVEPRIPKVKREVFENVPLQYQLNLELKSFYEKRIEKALRGLFHPPEKGMADRVFIVPDSNELSIKLRTILQTNNQVGINLINISHEIENKVLELRELDQKIKLLNSNPGAIERGNELREKRGRLLEQKEKIEDRLKQIESEREHIRKKLQELQREEKNLLAQVQKIKKGKSIRELAHKYIDAVIDIRQRAAILLRNEISQIVSKLWIDITDRNIEYSSLEFDEHWNCFLIKSNGKRIKWENANTSAGQRQVRILAFTEALRQLARYVPPLVVDTPLGRLDQEVKQSVLAKLYMTSHQSIILTTDSEIEPFSPLFEKIVSKLAKVYTLNPEGDIESQSYKVSVTNDYFKRIL